MEKQALEIFFVCILILVIIVILTFLLRKKHGATPLDTNHEPTQSTSCPPLAPPTVEPVSAKVPVVAERKPNQHSPAKNSKGVQAEANQGSTLADAKPVG